MRRITALLLAAVAVGVAYLAGLEVGVRKTLSLGPHEFMELKGEYERSKRRKQT